MPCLPSPHSPRCIRSKLAILQYYLRLLQHASLKMLSEQSWRKKKTSIPQFIYGHELHTSQALRFICSLAREEWLSSKADCTEGVPTVYTSTYLFIFRKSAALPPPRKSDHPTRLLFSSLAHLRNFNTAEYSQPKNIFYNYTHHRNCQYLMKDNFSYYKKLKRSFLWIIRNMNH